MMMIVLVYFIMHNHLFQFLQHLVHSVVVTKEWELKYLLPYCVLQEELRLMFEEENIREFMAKLDQMKVQADGIAEDVTAWWVCLTFL